MVNQSGHVTAIAILELLWGGSLVLVGLLFAMAGGTASKLIGAQFSEFGGDSWGTLGTMIFVMIGLVTAAVGSTGLVAGAGLMRYREWGRIFSLILATIAGILGIYSLIDLELTGFVVQAGFAAYAWIMLTRPHIVEMFRGQQQQQTVVVHA